MTGQTRPGTRQRPAGPRAERRGRRNARRRRSRLAALGLAVIVTAVVAVTVVLGSRPAAPAPRAYLGLFTPPSPASYSGVSAFTAATGVKPGLVVYYSAWNEPFRREFAVAAARHHAVPLVQIDPTNIRMRAIAAGRYDAYLRTYAAAVRAYGGRVVLSFGHEMNGNWYSWGYHHATPAAFVAAWRHIVTVFRQQGASQVTWLWTVNVIEKTQGIPSPAAWWPGRSYVTWVGIDGYYLKPAWKFAPLFGPTIKAVRALTLDPILISETAATPAAGKPAKIADLFAGIRAYGLLGFVWFDVDKNRDWRLAGPAAIAAFRRGAQNIRTP
jgi:mannan endo-1,4-beta-mannosidase